MKLKQLKSILDSVDTFDTPNVHLEQYPTPPDIAAHVMHHVFSQGELEGRCVADLGCGAGILTIGAAILNAGYVVGFDIDAAALQVCAQNCVEMEIASVDTVQWDLTLCPDTRWKAMFDTVVMNPPFGTRTKGLDMVFLKAALFMASDSVYSLHKTSTRETSCHGNKEEHQGWQQLLKQSAFIIRSVKVESEFPYHVVKKAKEWGVDCRVVAQLRYNIDRLYMFHKRDSTDIAVDFVHFSHH